MSISLGQQDWFKSFIDHIISHYDPESADERAANLPEGPEEVRGLAAVMRSLEVRGVANGLPIYEPSLSESGSFPEIKFLSTLKHQMEIILDVAVALQRPFEGDFGRLALLMIGWATLADYPRSEELADVWREVLSGQIMPDSIPDILEPHYIPLGQSFAERAILKDDPLLALPINQGISYFDIYLSGRLAVDLYDDARLQRHEIEQTHLITNSDRVHFVEAVIALAWSNGILEPEERNLIKKQIQMLNFSKKESRKLINLMITPSTPREFAQAFSTSDTGMFVMRQLIIASVVDGVQDNREQKFLFQTSKEFGLSETEFNKLQREMKIFLDQNKESIEQMKNYRRSRRPSMF
jgi:uncharacterized membrane protein YebE (DUF533 family)